MAENLSLWGYFVKCLRLYVDGRGRARRKEYWSFILFSWLCVLGVVIVSAIAVLALGGEKDSEAAAGAGAFVFLLITLPLLPPQLALSSRRLHDVGLSGWLTPLIFFPYLGSLFILVISLIPSQKGPNRYGPSPLEGDNVSHTASIFS